MQEFISEPLKPERGSFRSEAMGVGEPGLPDAFVFRGERCEVVELLAAFKRSEYERGHGASELYLRRHEYVLRMADGTVWTVYFNRQGSGGSGGGGGSSGGTGGGGGSRRSRWFLYTIERDG